MMAALKGVRGHRMIVFQTSVMYQDMTFISTIIVKQFIKLSDRFEYQI